MHSKKISNAERHKARSKGGKNKIIKVNDEFENFELNNFADVRKLNAVLINRVLQNELDLRIATGVCYNLNLQMKLIQFETIEKRVSDIEKSLFNPAEAEQRIKELFIGK
jgi:molybdenum cofactor biosynthesis enzyme MoaA